MSDIKVMTDLLDYVIEHQNQDMEGGVACQLTFSHGEAAPGVLAKGPIEGVYVLKTVGTSDRNQPKVMIDVYFTPDIVHSIAIPLGMAEDRLVKPTGAGNLIIPGMR